MKKFYTQSFSVSKKTNLFYVLRNTLLFCALFLMVLGGKSQTTVFLDPFNTAPLSANWVITKLDDGTSKVQMNSTSAPTNFTIYNDNSVDDSGTNKRAYMTGSLDNFQSPYKKKLNENGSVTWTFNMRHSKSTFPPHVNGLLETGNNNYAQLMVLVSSNADFLDANASGYAVTHTRDTLNTGIYKLVRFQGGLSATTNLTTLITSTLGSVLSNNWASVKVVYESATNTWSMYLRDDESTANAGYKNPMIETPAYTSAGSSVVDATHTSTELTSCGFFANNGIARAGSSAKANYANFGVRVTLSTGYTPILNIDYKIRSIQNGFAFDAEHAKVDVYNSTGILQKSTYVNGNQQFVMNSQGLYILRISTAKGETSIKYLVR